VSTADALNARIAQLERMVLDRAAADSATAAAASAAAAHPPGAEGSARHRTVASMDACGRDAPPGSSGARDRERSSSLKRTSAPACRRDDGEDAQLAVHTIGALRALS
jgi:hypothetical protein